MIGMIEYYQSWCSSYSNPNFKILEVHIRKELNDRAKELGFEPINWNFQTIKDPILMQKKATLKASDIFFNRRFL